MNNKLGRTDEERYEETFGNKVSMEELADARRQAAEMEADSALVAFYEEHGDAIRESEIEALDRLIQKLPRLGKAPITENEQIARLTVIALKLGLHDAAELVKRFVDTDPNFNWDDIKDII